MILPQSSFILILATLTATIAQDTALLRYLERKLLACEYSQF